ncbi:MAG: quinone oxidoreductase family protein [Povalibacter sp.]
MSYAIRFHSHGGPDVLQWEPIEVGDPAPDQVRLRHTAIGLNFLDVYERTGLYQVNLPAIPGREAAGVIEAVGSRIKQLRVGDRVAYAAHQSGAYSQARLMPADRLVKLPDTISDEQAAALMLKGLTAQVLLRQTYRVRSKEIVLVHAAAGGMGSLLVQWAKHLGTTVIATVGTESKVQRVRELGADHVLLTQGDWSAQVKERAGGRGVDVVYDSVGKDTFEGSLNALRPRGMMVTFGNSSGPVPPIAPLELTKRGSLFLTRPTLFHYLETRRELERAAKELFDVVSRSVVQVQIGQTYALKDAATAHRDLEARRTTGSTVLLP